MESITREITAVAMAIIGVATLAVLVSRNNNTTGVIDSATRGFGNVLGIAMGGTSGNNGPLAHM